MWEKNYLGPSPFPFVWKKFLLFPRLSILATIQHYHPLGKYNFLMIHLPESAASNLPNMIIMDSKTY